MMLKWYCVGFFNNITFFLKAVGLRLFPNDRKQKTKLNKN